MRLLALLPELASQPVAMRPVGAFDLPSGSAAFRAVRLCLTAEVFESWRLGLRQTYGGAASQEI